MTAPCSPTPLPWGAMPLIPILSDRFASAFEYAERKHRHQRRKGTAIPYVAHLLAVAALTLELGGDEEQAIAALLHDAVEDCGGEAVLAEIREQFGPRVARIVDACSDSAAAPGEDKAPWRQRKQSALARMHTKNEDALVVALADKTHNLRAILDDYAVHGDKLWQRFNAGRDDQMWYYRSLANTFDRLLPGPATERFGRLVRELEQAA